MHSGGEILYSIMGATVSNVNNAVTSSSSSSSSENGLLTVLVTGHKTMVL